MLGCSFRLAIVQRNQDVRRFDVAVDAPFLVRVLHRLAVGDKKLETIAGRQIVLVAVLGDRHAFDQFHYEV